MGKRVFVRVDLNIPLDDNRNIIDATMIKALILAINYLREHKANSIICSHSVSPKAVHQKYSLKPLMPKISELLAADVEVANDSIGQEVEKIFTALPNGGVILLKNVRFYKEEENNDPKFTIKLDLTDLYVNDAFGTVRRAHASTEGVTKYLKPIVAGFEVQNPKWRFTSIVGVTKYLKPIVAKWTHECLLSLRRLLLEWMPLPINWSSLSRKGATTIIKPLSMPWRKPVLALR